MISVDGVSEMVCCRPGERSRLIYRYRHRYRRAGERSAFTLAGCTDMLQAAHAGWLTVFHLQAYAPTSTRPKASGAPWPASVPPTPTTSPA